MNDISRHFIDFCCNQYSDVKSDLKFSISFLYNETRQQDFQNTQYRKSWCILVSVFEMLQTYYDIHVSTKNFGNYLYHILKNSVEKTGGNSEAIVNDFTQALNKVIRSNNVSIVQYSKDMNFTPGNNEIIIKDKMLALEEETLTKKIFPFMTTTNSVLHILQSLNEDNLLYTSSKGSKESLRYKLTVLSHGMKRRYAFIAIEKDAVLDNDIADMLSGIKTSEWFAKNLPTTSVIPIITNQNGFIASQEFAANRQDNLHFFTTGMPGYGKTFHLIERMCSLQKQGIRTVVFDVSGSFTREEIIEKLSVGGDDKILKEVENYVNEHITFHNIETEGIPIEPLMLNFSDDITEKKNILFSIIMSHFGSLGKVQEVFIGQLITNLIATDDLSIMNAYDCIVDAYYPEKQDSLHLQVMEHFSCFTNYECANRGWSEFLDNSKDIVIISMNTSSKTGGYALIDILMMSLFYHQRFNPAKHLGIFVDEIHSQNLKPQGPITQILREGRKFRTFLNYATQFLSKK
ncbi:MAG: type IV secretion system DNA-binding domain-containing protein, partial [Oscillospiraceae bacterium]|nr:type IV secretion system DNA-binding domain-containing protein [Oscillospiraceae bacterium]